MHEEEGKTMRELIVNRAQPEVDPTLRAWLWEIPVDLFFAAVVSGLMILGGLALLQALRERTPPDTRPALPLHAPLLAFGLVHICLLALFADLSHKLYVWNLYLTLQPTSPMSWGSWMLTLVYVVLVATVLTTLPSHWPWAARLVPAVGRLAAWLGQVSRVRALAWANVVLGTGLALYTGVLLATMVARPLWNTMVLPPLFLASGLAGAAALLALGARLVPQRAHAPTALIGGLINALVVPAPGVTRAASDVSLYTRLAFVFLVAQAILLLLFVLGLASGSASQIAALQIVLTGPFAALFWVGVVALGVLLPLALLAVRSRLPALAPPALVLLLAGGLVLRFVIVDAGQMSRLVQSVGPALGAGG